MGELTSLYFNISSLPLNISKLEYYLNSMNTIVDIIAISESKITKTVNVGFENYIKIPNYTLVNSPSISNFGGVAFFVHDSLNFDRRYDLELGESHLADSLFIEVYGRNVSKKCVFGVLYRHQQYQISDFTNFIQPTINKLKQMKGNYGIFGDFNINALLYNTHRDINSFLNFMYSSGNHMMINKPTRFPIGRQRGLPSIIDHLYVNDPELVIQSGMITSDITDHFPIFSIFKTGINKNAVTERYFINDFANFSIDAFNTEVVKFDLNRYCDQSIDQKFTAFHNHLHKCINKFAPLRKISRKEFKARQKPWISNSLQNSIDYKNHLFILIRHHNRNDLELYYKRYKKTLEKAIKRARKEHLSHNIDNSRNSSTAMWEAINEFLHLKRKTKQNAIKKITD